MLALTGCTGKIGGAVLQAILHHDLVPPSELVVCTSSDPEDARWGSLRAQGASIRQSNYEDPASMTQAFSGCSKLFLVSTPRIDLDFHHAPEGQGRERHHANAIRAAQVAGVEHIYYTSLAFGSESKAGVMQAHIRTEALLRGLDGGVKYTIIREGLYNESWPLYLGYYDPANDDRDEVVTASDGAISWTSIHDLGVATGLVLAEASTKYAGRTVYLSNSSTKSLKEVAAIVSQIKGREIRLKTVSREEYLEYYTKRGMDRASVDWWSTTYAALAENECQISDSTFDDLLSSRGIEPQSVASTVKQMLTG